NVLVQIESCRITEICQTLHFLTSLRYGVENEPANEGEECEEHEAGGENRRGKARHKPSFEERNPKRDAKQHRSHAEGKADQTEESERPLAFHELDDRRKDPPAIPESRQLALGAC